MPEQIHTICVNNLKILNRPEIVNREYMRFSFFFRPRQGLHSGWLTVLFRLAPPGVSAWRRRQQTEEEAIQSLSALPTVEFKERDGENNCHSKPSGHSSMLTGTV